MARGCEASDCRPARGYEVLLSRKSNLEWADTRRRSEARRRSILKYVTEPRELRNEVDACSKFDL